MRVSNEGELPGRGIQQEQQEKENPYIKNFN
jgi:hypothetical protein